jgi:hypothetical protein
MLKHDLSRDVLLRAWRPGSTYLTVRWRWHGYRRNPIYWDSWRDIRHFHGRHREWWRWRVGEQRMGGVVQVTRDLDLVAALAFGNRRPGGWTKKLTLNFSRGNIKTTTHEIRMQTGNVVAEVPYGQLFTGHLPPPLFD